MFLNLCKYELKNSYRSFLFMYAVLLISSFFIMMRSDTAFASQLMIFIYVAAIIALVIMVFVSIIRNYRKSMFSRKAYLTHTLPVAEWKLLLSKVIISLFWILISFVVIGISAYLISYDSLKGVYDIFGDIVVKFFYQANYAYLLIGCIQILQFILLVYFVITAVHTRFVPRFRSGVALVSFFVIDYAISFITDFISSLFLNTESTFVYEGLSYVYTSANVYVLIVVQVIVCALLFTGSVYILKRRMEIE